MIDHLSYYAMDYPATKRFYEAALAPLGYRVAMEMTAEWNSEFPTQRMCAFGPERKPIFWVIETKEKPTPRHVAFIAPDRRSVDAFHKAALGSGAKDNGAPGLRDMYGPNYYAAFALDPDGNNIEAVCHRPARATTGAKKKATRTARGARKKAIRGKKR